MARRVLLRLTQPGESYHDTRRRVPFSELPTRPEERETVEAVVDRLTEARLLTTGGPPAEDRWVEVSHEALIRGWPRLQRWVAEERAGLLVHRRLTAAAAEWERLRRDEGVLYRGAQLAEAAVWAERHPDAPNPLERAFLEASLTLEQSQRQRRLRRLRLLTASLAVGIIVVASLAVTASRERDRAERQHQRVEQQERLATSRALAARAEDTINARPVESILLSLQAFNEADTAEARGSLLRHLVEHRRTKGLLVGHIGRVPNVAFSPDGRTLATAADDATLRLWDVARRQLATLTGHTSTVRSVAFSPDGAHPRHRQLRSHAAGRDVATRREQAILTGHSAEVTDVVFSPDGRTLATAGDDATVRLWDPAARLEAGTSLAIATGCRVWLSALTAACWPGPPTPTLESGSLPTAESWSPSPATAKACGVWPSAPTGAPWPRLATTTLCGCGTSPPAGSWPPSAATPIEVLEVAFSPDGHTLATASADHTLRLWDVVTRREQAILTGHRGWVTAVVFSPDGHTLATASDDHTVRVWDVATRQELATFTGHTNLVGGVAFSPDGHTLATVGADAIVRLWDVAAGRELAALTGHRGWVWGVAFSPDGQTLATAGDDATVRVWDIAARRELGGLIGHVGTVSGVAFTPDGAHPGHGGRGRHGTTVGHGCNVMANAPMQPCWPQPDPPRVAGVPAPAAVPKDVPRAAVNPRSCSIHSRRR